MMFGASTSELAVIFFITLLLYGGKRLPELARSMGEAVREYNAASREPKYVEEKTRTKEDEEKEAILSAARELGIDTEGRSINEIAKDIVKVAEGRTL